VATKEYGVVITSPFISNAFSAVTRASVPLAKRDRYFYTQKFCQFLFQLLMELPVIRQPFTFPDFLKVGDKLIQRRQRWLSYSYSISVFYHFFVLVLFLKKFALRIYSQLF
jgi:hypothetical protein